MSELIWSCWPKRKYNDYWENKDANSQPSKEDYICSIIEFCSNLLIYSKNNQVNAESPVLFGEYYNKPHNENFIYFCEKLVYDVIVVSLIMSKKV